MTSGRVVGKRLLITAVVAMVVVGFAGALPSLLPDGGGVAQGPEHPEYAADRLAPDRLDSGGEAEPRGDIGTVLIDRSHANRFDKEDISALTGAINDAGGEILFTGITTGFESGLDRADVLVIIDPGTSYDRRDVDDVQQFVKNGGRVLIFGEPNRKRIVSSGLVAQLVTQRSHLTTVASPFGISFGSQYLYDMENNDGNFKNVVTQPAEGTDSYAVEDVDRVTMYTAATVEVNRGTVLLRTGATAERGNDETSEGFPVAVLSSNGRVMAVGDKSFLSEQYHSVADNDVFIQHIVEFMVPADYVPPVTGNQTAAPPAS